MCEAPFESVIDLMLLESFNHYGRFYGPGFFAPLLGLLLLGLLVFGIVYFVRKRRTAQAPVSSAAAAAPVAPVDHAMEALRMRFATGEISPEEYLQRSTVLTGGVPAPTVSSTDPTAPIPTQDS